MEDKLLKLLHDEHVLTEEQYQQVVRECEKSGIRSDAALEQLGIIDEHQLLEFLSGKFRMPVVDWAAYSVDQELLKLIPEHVAEKYTVFPYALERGKRQNKITLAIANPTNVSAIDDISFMTGCIVRSEISSAQAIQKAIQTYYRGGKVRPATSADGLQTIGRPEEEFVPSGIEEFDSLLPKLAASEELVEEDIDALSGLDREHPSTKLLCELLDIALERGVSEIQIEPYGVEQLVRFNLAGRLYQHTVISDQIGRGIALSLGRITHRTEPPASPKKEQSSWIGSFYTTTIRSRALVVVVHFYPTVFGEKILLKLKDSPPPLSIEELGFGEKSVKSLQRALTKLQGLFLFVSPSGHGKTTTLYAIIRKFSQSGVNILSVENPVESFIPGVSQIPFNSQISYQDWYALISYSAPDLLVLENVDTPLMAQLAFELASSTCVLASVTAPDPSDGLCLFLSDLLTAMGKHPQEILPYVLDSINGIVSQRLVRVICAHCKEKVPLSSQDIELLRWLTPTSSDVSDISGYIGKGCSECMQTGYQGQIGLFQLVKLDKDLKQFLLRNQPISSLELRRFLAKISPDTMKQQGFQKIRDGVTSPAEVRRVVFR